MIKMRLEEYRRNVGEHFKEFYKSIPKKNSIFYRKNIVDNSKLENVKDKIERFFDIGKLVDPMSIDKKNFDAYMKNLDLVKQFSEELRPEMIMEKEIFNQTQGAKNSRKILIPSVVEKNAQLIDKYDNMIAYYLLFGGNRPVERFSKVGMAMKQYGAEPDMRNFYNEIWK